MNIYNQAHLLPAHFPGNLHTRIPSLVLTCILEVYMVPYLLSLCDGLVYTYYRFNWYN